METGHSNEKQYVVFRQQVNRIRVAFTYTKKGGVQDEKAVDGARCIFSAYI